MTYPWQPATADVALLVAQRVLNSAGEGLDDFNADTTPTGAQVTALCVMVTNQIAAKTGVIPTNPVNLEPLAKNVAAKAAAWWVETSFYMDDLRGHADVLRTEYETALADLTDAVDSVNTTGLTGPGEDQPLPVFGFPSTNFDPRVPVTTWTTNF